MLTTGAARGKARGKAREEAECEEAECEAAECEAAECEAAECEAAAFEVGSAVAQLLRERGDETGAAEVDFSEWHWRRWSGEELLGKARTVAQKAAAIGAAPNAAQAVDYGVDAAAVAQANKEASDYAAFVNAPDAAISGRAALTRDLRNRFRATDVFFDAMDKLGCSSAEEGRTFVAEHFNSRQVIDRGNGPGEQPQNPPRSPLRSRGKG